MSELETEGAKEGEDIKLPPPLSEADGASAPADAESPLGDEDGQDVLSVQELREKLDTDAPIDLFDGERLAPSPRASDALWSREAAAAPVREDAAGEVDDALEEVGPAAPPPREEAEEQASGPPEREAVRRAEGGHDTGRAEGTGEAREEARRRASDAQEDAEASARGAERGRGQKLAKRKRADDADYEEDDEDYDGERGKYYEDGGDDEEDEECEEESEEEESTEEDSEEDEDSEEEESSEEDEDSDEEEAAAGVKRTMRQVRDMRREILKRRRGRRAREESGVGYESDDESSEASW